VEAMPAGLAAITDRLHEGLDAVDRTTAWLGQRHEAFDDVAAGATPYLRLLATVVGGVLLARGAAAAQRLLDEEASGADANFLVAKVTIARFFATQLLPGVLGLEAAVTAGATDLRVLEPGQLAP
jgi:3-(methylthio)propanoyl-CoA dehydrogenase